MTLRIKAKTAMFTHYTSAGFLLGTVPSAAFAFSLRRLRSDYTGACLRVRRSSDDGELDIGFAGNVLDETALLDFVGTGDGYVSTWYDQSGNGYDVAALTLVEQPQVAAGGEMFTLYGRRTLLFDPTDDKLVHMNAEIDVTNGLLLGVGKADNPNQGRFIFCGQSSTLAHLWQMIIDNSGSLPTTMFSKRVSNGTPAVVSAPGEPLDGVIVAEDESELTLTINDGDAHSASDTVGGTTMGHIVVGGRVGAEYAAFDGRISEVVGWVTSNSGWTNPVVGRTEAARKNALTYYAVGA